MQKLGPDVSVVKSNLLCSTGSSAKLQKFVAKPLNVKTEPGITPPAAGPVLPLLPTIKVEPNLPQLPVADPATQVDHPPSGPEPEVQ